MDKVKNLHCNTMRFFDLLYPDAFLERIDSRNGPFIIPRIGEVVWLFANDEDNEATNYIVRSIEHNYDAFGYDVIDIYVSPQEI